MRAARALACAASRVSLRACVRTRRPVLFDGVVAVALRVVERRAAGLRAGRLRAGRFFAAGLLVVEVVLVVLVVFSAMLALSPCPKDRVSFRRPCSPQRSRRTYVRKPKSWPGY